MSIGSRLNSTSEEVNGNNENQCTRLGTAQRLIIGIILDIATLEESIGR